MDKEGRGAGHTHTHPAMPGLHDFGSTSERQSSEREKKHRKHLIITGASASALLLLLVAGVAATIYSSDDSSPSSSSRSALHSTSKSVAAVCESTDFRHTCESSLSKAINSSDPDPRDLLKAAVAVVSDEVNRAFNLSKILNLLKSDDPNVKGAIQECRHMFYDSKDDLASSQHSITSSGIQNLPKRSRDLQTWLSAVMSYLQTCVDGFPEGELKQEMDKGMVTAKQLTSNALAIIGKVTSFLSSVDVSSLNRRLLTSEVDGEGVPYWVSQGDRRVLTQKRAGMKLKPHVVVAKDGSGNYTTITKALDNLPEKYKGRYVIYIKEGIYEETVNMTKKMENITMYGDGARKTIVTGSKNFVDGVRTYWTATFAAQGDGFMAIAMGFRNTAGAAKHQAVALRVQADKSIFLNCRMEGYQDTLYAQTHRQFYRGCIISGTVDFIFGDATAIFQKCTMLVRRPLDNQQTIVTAQGRVDRQETTGFVIQNCKIIPDGRLKVEAEKFKNYLGRPWKNCSRTVIMESDIDEFIDPEGYLKWEGAEESIYKTLYYAEYRNKGKGAHLKHRVNWPGFKVIEKDVAERFTVDNFLQAQEWLSGTEVPVRLGLYHS